MAFWKAETFCLLLINHDVPSDAACLKFTPAKKKSHVEVYSFNQRAVAMQLIMNNRHAKMYNTRRDGEKLADVMSNS